jgi:hypothetical protein
MKELALLTLQEVLRNEQLEETYGYSWASQQVIRRLPLPSRESLPSQTREYLLPPQLLLGPLSIRIGHRR